MHKRKITRAHACMCAYVRDAQYCIFQVFYSLPFRYRQFVIQFVTANVFLSRENKNLRWKENEIIFSYLICVIRCKSVVAFFHLLISCNTLHGSMRLAAPAPDFLALTEAPFLFANIISQLTIKEVSHTRAPTHSTHTYKNIHGNVKYID